MKTLTIKVDGHMVEVPDGMSVAAALHNLGEVAWRSSVRLEQPRGLYCGMGVCFECIVRIDGCDGLRACMTEVREGMVIETSRK